MNDSSKNPDINTISIANKVHNNYFGGDDLTLSEILKIQGEKSEKKIPTKEKSPDQLLYKPAKSEFEVMKLDTNEQLLLKKDPKRQKVSFDEENTKLETSTILTFNEKKENLGQSVSLILPIKKKEIDIKKSKGLKNMQLSLFKQLKSTPEMKSYIQASKIENLLDLSIQKNEYEKYFHECEKSNKKFTDKEFPPDQSSLSKDWKTLSNSIQEKWKVFVWRRANEIFGDDFDLFDGEIEPNDIKQGKLGDCYLLSSLSSLAERQHLVKKLFQSNTKNKFGIYGVWLNINGEWKIIVIDDYFPCLSKDTGPAFSRGNGNELWVLLIEKAYAKVYGSYQAIEGGNPAIALRELTGAPYENKDEADENELWNYIKTNDENGFILTSYTKSTLIKEEENDLGLLSGHAYAILDARSVKGKLGDDRIIKIRNPWGKVEWKGKWSDNSEEWTSQLKKELDVKELDDGTFWISIKDFRNYYEGVAICKYHENYVFNSIKIKTEKFSAIKLNLKNDSHQYISLNQKDDRLYFYQKIDKVYCYGKIFIAKYTEKGLIFVGASCKQDKVITVEAFLEKGDYIILIEMIWENDLNREVIIDTFGESHTILNEMKDLNENDYLLIQRNLFKSYALTFPKTQKSNDYSRMNHPEIKNFIGYDFGCLYFYYSNGSDNFYLEDNYQMTELLNLKIEYPFKDSKQFCIKLKPGKEVVVLFKFFPFNGNGVSYGVKSSTKLMELRNGDKIIIQEKEAYNVDYFEEFNHNKKNSTEEFINIHKENGELNEISDNNNISDFSPQELFLFQWFDDSIGRKISENMWSYLMVFSIILSLIFIILSCYERSNFIDLMIMITLLLNISSNMNSIIIIRQLFYLNIFSICIDILWFSLFFEGWTDIDFSNPDILVAKRKSSLVFSFLNFFFKIWIIIPLWRFIFKYEKMNENCCNIIYPEYLRKNFQKQAMEKKENNLDLI